MSHSYLVVRGNRLKGLSTYSYNYYNYCSGVEWQLAHPLPLSTRCRIYSHLGFRLLRMCCPSPNSTTAGGETMCYPQDRRGSSGGMRKLNACMCNRNPHTSWGVFLQDANRRKPLELVAMDSGPSNVARSSTMNGARPSR